MQFSKMHGLGNDFMVIDGITQNVHLSPDLIRRLADRHKGIGFEQLLLLEPPYDPEVDFHYRIFNADGNEVGQCGNGARCLAYFLHLKGLSGKPQIRISTKAGLMWLHFIDQDQITVDIGEPLFEPAQVPFRATRQEKTYILRVEDMTHMCGVVSVGNPHCVIQVEDLDNAAVAVIGAQIERHHRFPERVNVGFMQLINQQHIRLRVFERGVGETQACGSGACAAVAVGRLQGILDEQVKVELPGGTLAIDWTGPGHSLLMTGPATHVYDGVIRL